MKLTLLQTAVRSINDLRIVKTLDEFQSTTHGHGSSTSISYQTYYDLLINACVRYDKTKKANIGKRRNVYNSIVDPAYVDYHQDASDFVPESPYGGIDLPPDEFYQIHALPSRHPHLPGLAVQNHLSDLITQSLQSGPSHPSKCDRILNFYTFIPFLQYFQSVFQDSSVQVTEGFGSEGLKQVKMPLHGKQRV